MRPADAWTLTPAGRAHRARPLLGSLEARYRRAALDTRPACWALAPWIVASWAASFRLGPRVRPMWQAAGGAR